MYSVVLMAALAAGESTPELFFRHGCYGGGWGCYGGGGWGGGGCYGWGHSCRGYGICYGGCYGACYGSYASAVGGWGMPYGCYGPGYACGGGCGGYMSPAYGVPMAPVVGPKTEPGTVKPEGDGKKPKNGGDEEVGTSNRARLIVNLPSDGKLYVDDRPIRDAAPQKTFQTPALAKGQKYYYEVRAEVMRDGKPVSETRRVIVRAGATIRADFSSLGAATGVASAKK
jgi:uncharacterized protein (TIGR03000 family)